jgi:AI-2 transport protein TqsA
MDTIKNINLIFLFVLIIYLLSVLSSILIPFVLALLFAILFQPLVQLLKKIKAPNWLVLPVVSIITLAILYGIFQILLETTTNILEQQDYLLSRLQMRANETLWWINSITGMNFTTGNFFESFSDMLDKEFISSAASQIASGVGSFTGSFVWFSLYYVFLLAGLANYEKYIHYVASDMSENGTLVKNLHKIKRAVLSYMIVKTGVSIATGVFVTVTCLFFDIKFAFFWGLLTFLLNFIPSIGSILAVIPPTLMAIIQFDSIKIVLLLLVILGTIQFILGNIVEPKIQGGTLRINTLTVLFGLVFWGYIWGIPGMMLSVPLLVILKIIFEYFPSLSVLARIMGSPDDGEEEPKVLAFNNNSSETIPDEEDKDE